MDAAKILASLRQKQELLQQAIIAIERLVRKTDELHARTLAWPSSPQPHETRSEVHVNGAVSVSSAHEDCN